MPDYDTVIGSKLRKIELRRKSPNSYAVKVDGKPRDVILQGNGTKPEGAFDLEIDGKAYKIELSRVEREKRVPVKVEGVEFEVEVKASSRTQLLTSFEPASHGEMKKTGGKRAVAIEGAVTAPMTGKIVQVRVKKGDQVKTGQVLCVIEAMKMENELLAPRAGTVEEANVSEGAPVNEGDVLFLIA